MSKNLYGGSIPPKCEYCENGKSVSGEEIILCIRKGVMQPDSCCKKFKYNPLKRKTEVKRLQSDFS
ncbi:MAG: hypothetical protein LUH40_08335, partial [Clostridiales bacterium]|nr:hypothetical protein [Clostridiales bacterium]